MEAHHANIIIGEGDFSSLSRKMLLDMIGFDLYQSPDYLLFESESFGIPEARSLSEWASGKPLVGENKVSLVIANSVTFEAQNALLKIFEEPPAGTYFFVKIGNLGNILPTLLSRVRVIQFSDLEEKYGETKDGSSAKSSAAKFYQGSVSERLKVARSLAKKEDKNQLKQLIADLEKICFESDYQNSPEKSAAKMKNILAAKTFASIRGSSPKMLAEWLSSVI